MTQSRKKRPAKKARAASSSAAHTGRTDQLDPQTAGVSELLTGDLQKTPAEDLLVIEKRFSRAMIDSLPGIFYMGNARGKFIRWNQKFTEVTGYTSEEIGQLRPGDIFADDDWDHIKIKIREVFSAGEATAKAELIAKDGRRIPYFFTGKKTVFNNRPYLIGVGLDLSKLKKAKRQLKRSKERHQAFIHNSSEGIWCFEMTEPLPTDLPVDEQIERIYRDGVLIDCNKKMARMYGFDRPEEMIGKLTGDLMIRSDPANERYLRDFIESGYNLSDTETHEKDSDGNDLYFLNNLIGVIEKDRLVRAWGTQREITELKKKEAQLRKTKESYQAFIKTSSEGIWCFEMTEPLPTDLPVDEQIERIFTRAKLVECNDGMARMYGYQKPEELLGKALAELLDPADPANVESLRVTIESGYQILDQESRELDQYGNEVFFLNNVTGTVEDDHLIRLWGTQRDITALKQTEQAYIELEKQLRQSQKIEPLGRLAGGIAHDFNNFLAVIMLHTDMINRELPEESPLRFRLNEIKTVSEKAAGMVRQLLAFGRKQMLQPQPANLNQVVEEFIKAIGTIIGENIEIQLDLEKNLGVCIVDPNQMIQVLMNLAVNARDAMPDGGTLEIGTANIEIDKNTFKHKAQPKGSYVQLSVADTGIGMDATTKKHVFEPFFTTKGSREGTGLGLATVYGIIKQSKGFIWVDSKPGQGTTFQIQFPRSDKSARLVKKEKPAKMLRGTETILLVEDEEPIRHAAMEILTALGYKILEAKDTAQALELAESYEKEIHLLLTDVVMPKMNGRELARRVKLQHEETSVLFISGYTDDIIARHGILEEDVHFLGKPFSPATLAQKVRQALGS